MYVVTAIDNGTVSSIHSIPSFSLHDAPRDRAVADLPLNQHSTATAAGVGYLLVLRIICLTSIAIHMYWTWTYSSLAQPPAHAINGGMSNGSRIRSQELQQHCQLRSTIQQKENARATPPQPESDREEWTPDHDADLFCEY